MNCVALDIGNVLCRVDFTNFTSALSKTLNISVWEAGHRINRYQKLHDVGLLTMQDILESEFGIKSQVVIDELSNAWKGIVRFDPQVLRYFEKFDREHGLMIALLSNVGPEHAEMIKLFLQNNSIIVSSVFRAATCFFSCDVGVRKPNTLYFQSFIQQYPLFNKCVFVDDRKENLEASDLFAFTPHQFDLSKIPETPKNIVTDPAHFFTESEELKTELDKIGELILSSCEEEPNSRWH